MSQALAGFVQAVPPGQGPGLPLLHLQMLAIVTSQAASDRATRAARERVMARIFQLSVSEDVYIALFVAGGSVAKPCNTMQYQYTCMGQCKCPQGGNRLLMDKKRLRHRERERVMPLQFYSCFRITFLCVCSAVSRPSSTRLTQCSHARPNVWGPKLSTAITNCNRLTGLLVYWVIRSLKHTANCKPYLESLKGERRHRG